MGRVPHVRQGVRGPKTMGEAQQSLLLHLSSTKRLKIHSTLRLMTSQSTSDNLNLPQYGLAFPHQRSR
jgi:hypothetical protein